jgi:ubiquitin fusion degradation protein 1
MFGGFGFGGGDGGFFGANSRTFDKQYQAFPVSFIGKEELEKGNKIILPQSALDTLARLNISYPMLFEISNQGLARRTHCGVQEFIAEEGTCYLPYWMMQNMLLNEGDLIRVINTSLPKGSFVKLQPVSSDFLNIHNPRAVLENSLRNYATLTVGDSIVIDYNQKKYEIEIAECKPAAAISIIEADVNVDFAPPKDYKEPELPAASSRGQGGDSGFAASKVEESEIAEVVEEKKAEIFTGQGQRVDGKPIKTPLSSPAMGAAAAPNIDENEHMPWKNRIPKGVKWTKQPYMYGVGHMTAQQGGGSKGALPDELFGGSGQSMQ